MTVLWCGGEDSDFPNGVSVQDTYNTGKRRTSWSRVSLYASGYWWSDKVLDTITYGWLSVQAYCYGNRDMCGLVGEDGITGYWFTRASGGKVQVRKYDSGWSTLSTESGASISSYQVYKIDMEITYGVSGTIKVYVDGSLFPVIDYSGDLTISGLDGFTRVGGRADTSEYGTVSELLVADEDTRRMGVKTLALNAAGDTNDWTGAYTAIDEATTSDADKIYTETKGDDFQANLTGMPAGSYKVRGVRTMARAIDDQGALGLKVGIKTNSVIHLGAVRGLTPAYAIIEKIYSINPQTSTFFTSGEIDALQIALRCDSTTSTTTTTMTTTTTS